MRRFIENIGQRSMRGVAEFGQAAVVLAESLYWLFLGPRQRQPVRLHAVFAQAMDIGIHALPIVGVLGLAIGVMLAIQGIYTLRVFGAENNVTLGITLSVTREFAPMITGILVAGRTGSALAARIGTMKINEELDALTVMGIQPIRYLVAPALIAMLIMLPILSWFADAIALLGAGIYVSMELGMSLGAYWQEVIELTSVDDLLHGLGKSFIFGVLIVLIGVVNGANVSGGAEGIGRVTTRSVVHAISAIVITDM